MVLQDYGAAMPLASESAQPSRKSSGWKYGAVAALCVGSLALVLLIGGSPQTEKTALLQTKLGQHLMSQFSRDSTNSDSDEYGENTLALSDSGSSSGSGTSFYDNWGHHSMDGNQEAKATSKWQSQLQKLQAGAEERRKEEDKEFFSGVDKAFGKKAGKAMMAAFNGASKTSLSKMKLDEKKLKEKKAAIADNSKLPDTKKQKVVDVKKAVKEAAKKSKEAAAPKKDSKADEKAAKEHKKAHNEAVKAALKVAKDMAAHKDPVAKDKKEEQKKADAKKAHKESKAQSLKKVGVIGDAEKVQKLVHEFSKAHGKKKKELKARVQSLEQQIKDDFSRVTSFGHRAETKFARETAKTAPKKKHRHDMSDDN